MRSSRTSGSNSFALNFIGIPSGNPDLQTLSHRPPPTAAADDHHRQKIRALKKIISVQRRQLSRLVMHCQNLEGHIRTMGGILPEIPIDDSDDGPGPASPPPPAPSSPSPPPSSSTAKQKRLDQVVLLRFGMYVRLAALNNRGQIRVLERRLQTVTDCLKSSARDGTRWHTGPRRHVPRRTSTAAAVALDPGGPARSLSPDLMQILIGASHEADIREVLRNLCRTLPRILSCNRVVVFLVDEMTGEMASVASNYLRNDAVLRINSGRGITGHCTTSGESIRVINACKDSRYDQGVDGVTRALMCIPLRDPYRNTTIAVFQCSDKSMETCFLPMEQSMMELTASYVSLRLCNDQLLQRSQTDRWKLSGLFSTAEALMSFTDIDHVLTSLTAKICTYMQADYGVIFGLDRDYNELVMFSQYTTKHMTLRVPGTYAIDRHDGTDPDTPRISLAKSSSLVAKAANNIESFAINEASADNRFNPTFDEYLADIKSYGQTSSILVQAIYYQQHERVVAALVIGSTKSNAFSGDKIEGIADYHELARHSIMKLQATRLKTYRLRNEIQIIKSLLNDISDTSADRQSDLFFDGD